MLSLHNLNSAHLWVRIVKIWGAQGTLDPIEIMEFVMDEAKVGALSKRIMGIYEGALVSGMVYLGDEMGLYRAMHEQGPLTSEQVATRAGLHERFVREWLSLKQLQASSNTRETDCSICLPKPGYSSQKKTTFVQWHDGSIISRSAQPYFRKSPDHLKRASVSHGPT